MKIPFLKNFRRGFATNSSSSHSFVYMKDEQGIGEEGPSSYTDSEFGWNDFRLGTIREKLFYVLVGRIGGGWGSDQSTADEDFEELGDQFPELTEQDFAAAKNGYIDHQSQYTIDEAQARDPHLVVFGGNDNSGDSQERAAAIRAGEIDWSRTKMDVDDLEHIRMDDEEGQKMARDFINENPWAKHYFG